MARGRRRLQLDLADQLPDAVQILDWHHAVEHGVDCGKVLLGEESLWLPPPWQRRAEELLAAGAPAALLSELMECLSKIDKGRRDQGEALRAIDDLVRYYRTIANRMKYRLYPRERAHPAAGAYSSRLPGAAPGETNAALGWVRGCRLSGSSALAGMFHVERHGPAGSQVYETGDLGCLKAA